MEYKGVYFVPPKSQTYLLWIHSIIDKHKEQEKTIAATMKVMKEDAFDDIFKTKMNLFVDGIACDVPCPGFDQDGMLRPTTNLERHMQREEALREATAMKEYGETVDTGGTEAAGNDYRPGGWGVDPWLDSDIWFKVPLHMAITASARKKLDPWLKLKAGHLDELPQKQGIPVAIIMAQEYAIRC